MIVDLLSRAFEDELSCTIIDYHQLSCSLDWVKFGMIVGYSFCCLNKLMMGRDSFAASVFFKKGLKLPQAENGYCVTIVWGGTKP